MTKRTADSPPDPLRGIVSFKDSLGVRLVDPSAGDSLERLVLCAELAPLETPIRDRVARLSNFRHVRFPRVRGIEVHGTGGDRVATITFDRTAGVRLSELQRPVDRGDLVVDVNAALQVAREALPALAVLHDSRAVAHGAIALERMILTPHGRVVLVDHVLGSAIEKLQYPRTRLWKEFRIAVPPSAGLPRFDARSDVAQVALAMFLLVLGRPLALKEFPDGVRSLLQGANERLASGALRPMTPALRGWFERALPIESRKPFVSALDAQVALEDVVKSSHAYAPTASTLRVIHDRYVAWEGAQRAAGDPETGHVEPASGHERQVAPVAGRKPPRRPALRVVHDDEADEIRHLEAELERIRKEEALAGQLAVGAESAPIPPSTGGAHAIPETSPVLQFTEHSPAAASPEPDGAARDAAPDDVLTIDLDALAEAVGLVGEPEGVGAPEPGQIQAESAWELRPPSELGSQAEPATDQATVRDELTTALPFDAALEPEPDTPSLGRFLATAASTTPPALTTSVVNRLAEETMREEREAGKRRGRYRRPGQRRARVAAALPADATPVQSTIAVPVARVVDQAASKARALHLAAPAALDQIVRRVAPALGAEATPVAAGLATPVPPSTLEQAAAVAAPLSLLAGAAAPENLWPAPSPAIPAQATPVVAALSALAAEPLLDRAVRDFAPLRLVPGQVSEPMPLTAEPGARGDEHESGPPSGVAPPATDVLPVADSDDIVIDAEAFELADGVQALPPIAAPVADQAVAPVLDPLAVEPVVDAPVAAQPAGRAVETVDHLTECAGAAPVPPAPPVFEPEVTDAPPATDVIEVAPESPAPEAIVEDAVAAAVPVVEDVVAEAAAFEPPADELPAAEPVATDVFVPADGETGLAIVDTEVAGATVAESPADESTAVEPVAADVPVTEAFVTEAWASDVPVAGAFVAEAWASDVPVAEAFVADAASASDEPEAGIAGDQAASRAPDPVGAGISATDEAAPAEAAAPPATDVVEVAPGPPASDAVVEDAVATDPPVMADEADVLVVVDTVVAEATVAEPPADEPPAVEPADADVPVAETLVAEAGAPDVPAAEALVGAVVSDSDESEAASVDGQAESPSLEPAGTEISVTDVAAPAEGAEAPGHGPRPGGESKRRRKARRPSGWARSSATVALPEDVDVQQVPATFAPARIEPPVAVEPVLSARADADPAAGDTGTTRSGVGAGESAEAGAPAAVPFVAPWLRGRQADTPAEPGDVEEVVRPVIVNFEREEHRLPEDRPEASAASPASADSLTTADWQQSAAPTVVPFAPPVSLEERPRVRPRPEPPTGAPAAPPDLGRPRINWRRTAAASLLVILIEGAAFGAAYWYVKPPERGVLSVRTNLPGIEVLVDGRPSGTTPASLELTPGRHSIELRGAGVSKVVPVEITAGVQTTQLIQWPKSARVGRLQVRSTPPGARVKIGYELKGTTPVTIESLPVGSHEVVVESDAGSVRSTVKVRADQTEELDVGIYSGWLAVFAPVEVRIFEGGKMIGTTLDGRLMMRPGTHTLELRNPSLGFNESRKVEITPGRVTALSLQAPTGTLVVDAPAGTEVVVDGDVKGTAPLASMGVAVGTREVVLRHPQLGQRRFVVTVGARVPAQVSFMSPP